MKKCGKYANSENDKIILSEKMMKQYYDDFDAVEVKYRKLLSNDAEASEYLKDYQKFQKYEDSRQFAELTKKDDWNLQANLDMAYADLKKTDDFLDLYDALFEKVVCEYINIGGMERLFSEKYADFEWEMHLGLDYKKHSMKFYRDHFIHQIKDTYTMDRLLTQAGFYEKIKGILLNEGNSKISRYVHKMLQQQESLPKRKIYKGWGKEDLREHYTYNIIYMSCYMAGLFHDIGYPAGMSMEENRRMIDYLAEVCFFQQGGYDFKRIMLLLQNSLLFRVVAPSEIRSRIEGDKVDHGTMSALLFLLHFYENGAIHKLEPYELCAVELAGLAIYNHTNKYDYLKQKGADYERCVFSLNPISYLLRVCDDMQEWGRIYFEISSRSNLIFCNRCYTPVIRKKIESESGEEVIYQCRCSDREFLFKPIFDYEQFPNRRIYNVTVCNSVEIKKMDKNGLTIHLEYDLDNLLHIAFINPSYAKYRTSELATMKRLFPRQDQIGMVFVNYFVTANVLLIKSAIVKKYLFEKKKGETLAEETVRAMMDDLNFDKEEESLTEDEKKKKQKEQYERIMESVEECVDHYIMNLFEQEIGDDDVIRRYLKQAFVTYCFIAYIMEAAENKNSDSEQYAQYSQRKDHIREWVDDRCWSDSNGDMFYTEDCRLLLEDCAKQASLMFKDLSAYTYYPEVYFDSFKAEENCYSTVKRFVDTEGYQRLEDNGSMQKPMKLDAYTDLYFVLKLLK